MSYAPLHIKNPSSLLHVTRVRPGQQIVVSLDKTNMCLDIQTEFLKLDSVIENEKGKQFTLTPRGDLEKWSQLSTFYLGEVTAGEGNLLVYLDSMSEVKRDMVTVLNPGFDTVRLKPNQIMEVVLFNPSFSGRYDRWTWQWYPKQDLQLDEICYKCMIPNYYHTEPDLTDYFATVRRSPEGVRCTQHHFWFRFEKNILQMITKEDCKAKFMGRLIFTGSTNWQNPQEECVEGILDLYVDIHKKHYLSTIFTMNIDGYGSKYNHLPRLPAPAYVRRERQPLVREVDLTRIPGELDEGCKTMIGE